MSAAPRTPAVAEQWVVKLVAAAKARIDFYRDHLAAADGSSIGLLPTFDKSATRGYGRFPLSAGGAAGAHRVVATSGTSGHRLCRAFDRSDWERAAAWWEAVGRRAGLSQGDVLLNTHCYGLWVGGHALDLLAQRCRAGLVPLGPADPAIALELVADGVASAISATPSYLRRLVEAADASRVDLTRSRLRVGFIGAEPAEPSLRRKLQGRLPDGFLWVELYGLTETAGPTVAFNPDPSVHELTVNTRDYHVEVLDRRADVAVCPGEVGELTLTTRHAASRSPLVRYRTGDLVRVTGGKPDAPTHISEILGRADGSLKVGGVLVYPTAVAEIMSELLPASAEWRAVLRRRERDDELLVEAEAPIEACDAIVGAFRHRVGLNVNVIAAPAGALARSRAKTQRILVDSAGASAPGATVG